MRDKILTGAIKLKTLVAAACAALFSTSTYAADIAAVGVAPFSWTGAYAGVNAGIGWNAGNQIDGTTYHLDGDVGTYDNEWFNSQSDSNKNSFTGGAQIGYNYQFGSVVLGIEADLNYLNAKSSYSADYFETLYSDASPDYNYNLKEDLDAESKIEWFGTIRPRIGVTPSERLLVYGTGGLAYGKVKSSGGYQWHEYGYWWGGPGDHNFDRSGGFSGSSSSIRWGWTIGAGTEYALTDKISLKGEYLYTDLGSKDHTAFSPDDSEESVTWSDSAKFHSVRVGLNYKF